MLEFIDRFLDEFVYAGMFMVLLAAGLGVPIPEDIPLILGGVAAGARPDQVDWRIVLAVGLVGVMVGDCIIFWAGRHWGPAGLEHRWVRAVVSAERLRTLEGHFARHSNRFIFFGRFVAGIRAPTFFAAGAFGVGFWRFFFLDLLAAVLSVPVWIWLGWYFATEKDWLFAQIELYKRQVFLVLAVSVLLLLAWWLFRRRERAVKPER